HSYAKNELNWGIFGKDYYTSIGIRADEIDRISAKWKEFKILYPLAEKGITKKDRNKFWDQQPIHLGIPAFMGNCKNCFEFTMRKLATAYLERPEDLDWNLEMQSKYSHTPI